MGKISAVRAVLGLGHELDKVGLFRTSRYNGGAIAGWIEKNRIGSTGFSIRPLEDGKLDWHLVISGKPHMRYSERRELEGDDIVTLHYPDNPEVVFPKIKMAFQALGLAVMEVKCTGWQGMWDDDVDFNVKTAAPDWLAAWDLTNREIADGFLPRLGSGSTARDVGSVSFAAMKDLPVYDLGDGKFALTREGVEAFIAASGEYKGQSWSTYGIPSFDESGNFVVVSDGRKVTSFARNIENFWGDTVEVFTMPRGVIEPALRYSSELPVLIGGEFVKPDFVTLDAQYGNDAPWSVEPAAFHRP